MSPGASEMTALSARFARPPTAKQFGICCEEPRNQDFDIQFKSENQAACRYLSGDLELVRKEREVLMDNCLARWHRDLARRVKST